MPFFFGFVTPEACILHLKFGLIGLLVVAKPKTVVEPNSFSFLNLSP